MESKKQRKKHVEDNNNNNNYNDSNSVKEKLAALKLILESNKANLLPWRTAQMYVTDIFWNPWTSVKGDNYMDVIEKET
jgi:hypothetical protein